MEVTRPLPEEALPSELPETRPNRLRQFADKLRHKDAPAAPEAPPPLLVEQLAALQATEKPKKKEKKAEPVEVTIENVPEPEVQRSEARRRLEAVYEERSKEEAPTLEDLPDEARRERRAEIKTDQPAMTAEERGLADSVGKILADLHQKTAAAHAAFQYKRRSMPWPNLPVIGQLPVLYQQAMAAGFAAGILLIIGYVTITSL